MSVGPVFGHESYSGAQAGPLFIGDPAKHGALRINPRSDDREYIAKIRAALHHDVSDDRFTAIANLLHCDEVASTVGVPVAISPERYGAVDRQYVLMTEDGAVPPAAQAHMIKTVDESGIGGVTTVHEMSGSQSPFFAKPKELRDVFVEIAD